MHSLGRRAHFWDRCASPKPLGWGRTDPFGQALVDRRALPSLQLRGPQWQCHPVPLHRRVASYSRCRTTRTAQWWEGLLQAISITVHRSLLPSNTCWAVEQKLSKKELFLLAVFHSSCGDSEGQHCSPTQGLPSITPPHRQACRMSHP